MRSVRGFIFAAALLVPAGSPRFRSWAARGLRARSAAGAASISLEGRACRRCCGLDWACRHINRTVPSVHRIMKWRRMIGIDPHPFADIPRKRRHHKRYARIAARIRIEEGRPLGHLIGINRESPQVMRLFDRLGL